MIPTEQVILTLADSMHRASGMHVGIHDLKYTVKAVAGDDCENLCRYCRQRCPAFFENCGVFDTQFIETVRQTKKRAIYRCHMGMTDAILPILSEKEEVIGVVFLGQVRIIPDSTWQFDRIFETLISSYPTHFSAADREGLHRAFKNTTTMTQKTFDGFLDLISMLADSFGLNHWIGTRTPTSDLIFRTYLERQDLIRMPMSAFSAQKIANEMNLSYSQLNRISNRVVEMPLKQYVLHLKVDAAAKLLSEKPELTVQAAADAVGIGDAHYLSRLFRKRFGMGCTEYAKMQK